VGHRRDYGNGGDSIRENDSRDRDSVGDGDSVGDRDSMGESGSGDKDKDRDCKGNLTDLRRILHLSLAKGNPK
jgi:hypothetical protein